MKTIEERAWEKYPEVIKHHNLAQIDINEEKRRMYIEIATEQKKIDDANLDECIKELAEANADYLDCMVKLTEKEMIDKAKRSFCKAKECVPYEECHRANGGCFAMQRFIKAMEE